jgi:hypothetical protein
VVTSPEPLGAALRLALEWRRDYPLPQFRDDVEHLFFQIYVDDMDIAEKFEYETALALMGSISEEQALVRAAYSRANVKFVEEKANRRQMEVVRLGADVDGRAGRSGAEKKKLVLQLSFLLWLVGQALPSIKAQQMVLGRGIHIADFRRPLMGVFNEVWRWMSGRLKGSCLPDLCVIEYLISGMLLPLAFANWRSGIDGKITASDASEAGGGGAVTTGLRSLGKELVLSYAQERRREEIDEKFVSRYLPRGLSPPVGFSTDTKRRILLVNFCDDLGCARIALSRLRASVILYVSLQSDSLSKRLLRLRWPGILEWISPWSVTRSQVERLADRMREHVELVLFVGRFEYSYDMRVLDQVRLLQSWFRAEFKCPDEFIFETPCVSDLQWRCKMSEKLGMLPIILNARAMGPCAWSSLYWVSTAYQYSEVHLRAGWHCMVPKDGAWSLRDGVLVDWLNADTHLVNADRYVPGPRDMPCSHALDLQGVPSLSEAIERCLCSETGVDGRIACRLPVSAERERLWRVDEGYTEIAARSSGTATEKEEGRCRLLREALNTPGLTWLMGWILHYHQVIDRIPSALAGWHIGYYPPEWGETREYHKRNSEATEEEKDVVASYIRRADVRGSDVRLDIGVPFRPAAWPRAAVPARAWTWGVITGYQWKTKGEHINVYELRASLNTLKWRLRNPKNFRKKFFHLLDSQVVLSIHTRHRSSSRSMQGSVRRFNALLLASGCTGFFGYISTHDNPADPPSRWVRKSGSLKPKTKPRVR